MTVGVRNSISRRRWRLPAKNEIVTPACDLYTVSGLIGQGVQDVGTAAWFAANKAMVLPFFLQEQKTVYQLGWVNGTNLTDNIDVGIYRTDSTRIVSTGSTARSGSSVAQWVDIADTVLAPGQYWHVCAMNGATAGGIFVWSSVAVATILGISGVKDSGDNLFALPDPITNMASAVTTLRIPQLLMAFRSVV